MSSEDMFSERKRSPLVLVGALATAGVLAAGLVAFKKGNQNLSQSLMRTRVLFQGATVAVMVITSGAWTTGAFKLEPNEHTTSQLGSHEAGLVLQCSASAFLRAGDFPAACAHAPRTSERQTRARLFGADC
jgi:hypothetical protein